ncbi:unnamed protein product, partial [Ixodes hexagonus]
MIRKERYALRPTSVDRADKRSSKHKNIVENSNVSTPPFRPRAFMEYEISIEDAPSSECSHGSSRTPASFETAVTPNIRSISTLEPSPRQAILRVISKTSRSVPVSLSGSESELSKDEVGDPGGDPPCLECLEEYIEQERRSELTDTVLALSRSHIHSDSTVAGVISDKHGLPYQWPTRLQPTVEREPQAVYYRELKPLCDKPVESKAQQQRPHRQDRRGSTHVMFKSRGSESSSSHPVMFKSRGSESSLSPPRPSTQRRREVSSSEMLVREAYDRYERDYQKYLENMAAWERQQQLVRDRLGLSTAFRASGQVYSQLGTPNSTPGTPYSGSETSVAGTFEEPMRVRVQVGRGSSGRSTTSVGSTR